MRRISVEPRTIMLVRHAVTQANVDRIRAPDHAPILAAGREQALRLARRLAGLGFEHVWSSPTLRARQTAEVVAAALGLPLSFDEALRDLECGPWTGLSDDEIARRFPAEFALWNTTPSRLALAGHETLGELHARVTAALERIAAGHRAAICVTHLGPIRVAALHCAGRPLDHFGEVSVDHCHGVAMMLHPAGCEQRSFT